VRSFGAQRNRGIEPQHPPGGTDSREDGDDQHREPATVAASGPDDSRPNIEAMATRCSIHAPKMPATMPMIAGVAPPSAAEPSEIVFSWHASQAATDDTLSR